MPIIIKTLRGIAEARKGSYSYESAPRERVRERTLCLVVDSDYFVAVIYTVRSISENIEELSLVVYKTRLSI